MSVLFRIIYSNIYHPGPSFLVSTHTHTHTHTSGRVYVALVLYSFHCLLHMFLICFITDDVHLVTWLRPCLPGFSTVKLLLSLLINMNFVKSPLRLDMYPSPHQTFNLFTHVFLSAQTDNFLFHSVGYNPSLSLFILILQWSHIWLVWPHISRFLCASDTIPSFFGYLLRFWHMKMF